jgi:hypothetical protein
MNEPLMETILEDMENNIGSFTTESQLYLVNCWIKEMRRLLNGCPCAENEICPKCCDHHANTGIDQCYNCGADFS